MYYYVDIEKVKTIFFNELASGRAKGNSITLYNVWYRFDDNLEIEELGIVNENEKTIVPTTKGFVEVEFFPDTIIKCSCRASETLTVGTGIANLKYLKRRVEENEIEPVEWNNYVRGGYLENTYALCSGYVCINELDDVINVLPKNFIAESTARSTTELYYYPKILPDDKWLTFDFSESKKPAVLGVKVDNEIYRLYFIDNGYNTIKIRKGTCLFIPRNGKVLCIE